MTLCAGVATLLATLAADAPRREPPEAVGLLALGPRRVARSDPGAESTPRSLLEARRLADQLRYEEAIVEYQRYLADNDRPANERAKALLEMGFIYLVLGDESTAQRRAVE